MNIRVGIIGWGEIGRFYASLLTDCGAEFAALVSRKSDLEVNVPIYSSLAEMLPHIDAVIVAVPNFLHASFCLQSVAAGKPVLVEKPLCINRDELDKLQKTLPAAKVPVHLGYRLRWNPSMQKLKKRLYNVRRIECVYHIGINRLAEDKEWTLEYAKTGGAFFGIGVHALDLARWLTGAAGHELKNLISKASVIKTPADYPLRVKMSGRLSYGPELIAGADLTGQTDSVIDLKVAAERGNYPDPEIPPPQPQDEKKEFTGMLRYFINAVRENIWDAGYTAEVLQTHQELFRARSRQRLK